MALPRLPALIALPIALAIAGLSALDAARNVFSELNPAMAARLPGGAGAQVADYLATPEKVPPKDAAFAVARERLRREPLDARALNLMAFVSDPKARTGAAVPYARVATEVSRRVTFSQLVMTTTSLRGDDVGATIDRFDAILRSRPEAGTLFFPYLAQVLPDPRARAAIAELATSGSPWVLDFLVNAGVNRRYAGPAADVMLRAGRRIPAGERARYGGPLLTRAVEAGAYADARRVAPLIPGGSAALFDSPELSRASLDPRFGSAAWQLASTSTGSASAVGQSAGKPAISLYATGGSHDVLAGKVMLLAPGAYRLRQDVEFGGGDMGGGAVSWRLSCVGQAKLWQGGNLVSDQAARPATIAIPAGCPAQRLELVSDIPFGQPSIDLTVRSVTLERVAAASG